MLQWTGSKWRFSNNAYLLPCFGKGIRFTAWFYDSPAHESSKRKRRQLTHVHQKSTLAYQRSMNWHLTTSKWSDTWLCSLMSTGAGQDYASHVQGTNLNIWQETRSLPKQTSLWYRDNYTCKGPFESLDRFQVCYHTPLLCLDIPLQLMGWSTYTGWLKRQTQRKFCSKINTLLILTIPDVTLRSDPHCVYHLSVTVSAVVYYLELGSGSFQRMQS